MSCILWTGLFRRIHYDLAKRKTKGEDDLIVKGPDDREQRHRASTAPDLSPRFLLLSRASCFADDEALSRPATLSMRPPGRLSLRIGVYGFRGLRGFGCRQAQVAVPSVLTRPCMQPPWPAVVVARASFQTWPPAPVRSFFPTARPQSAAATSVQRTGQRTGSTAETATTTTTTASTPEDVEKAYFLSNGILDRIARRPAELAPHRRRQARRQAEKISASSSGETTSPDLFDNASSILSDVAAAQPQRSTRRVFSSLLALTKPRLTVLVVLSAMAPYALYPVPAFLTAELLDVAQQPPSLSPLTLLFLTVGTTLCSAAANALNMLYEPDTDARMSRTRNRPLVRLLISRRAALAFAVACSVVGIAALHFGVNPTVAFLGAANIALYAGVYTPMKRLSAANTWVGALVGAIPPLMGWAAAAGESATGTSSSTAASTPHSEFRELLFAPDGSSAGGWLLAALLFAWQFPHFMALSWSVRSEYQRAGLRMLAWVNPARNGRVALRYSLAFFPICLGLCAANVTEWSFAATSLPVNVWLVREAVRFWQLQGHAGSARALFWASVWHLPALMVLALLQKKGMWARVWRSIAGHPDRENGSFDDDDEYDDDDDDYVWVADDGKQQQQKLPVSASGQ
ncbi:heme A biosynthesis protein [Grosmannia clavigera kw1407]|uniref:Protoheme IX farnesyltransferase, mitochondrial n=1 Tax=Grosmannia clavigera (strain kw1407 / UAMH 11150) TaxID=655863 RepID=F0XJM0_GROCL|nr:heme A biosynthesis protein [Grosmannia clavigera kw1407]EFX02185.1 heme A biosynthesis protein [Grosmannia clavigera kw1407]